MAFGRKGRSLPGSARHGLPRGLTGAPESTLDHGRAFHSPSDPPSLPPALRSTSSTRRAASASDLPCPCHPRGQEREGPPPAMRRSGTGFSGLAGNCASNYPRGTKYRCVSTGSEQTTVAFAPQQVAEFSPATGSSRSVSQSTEERPVGLQPAKGSTAGTGWVICQRYWLFCMIGIGIAPAERARAERAPGKPGAVQPVEQALGRQQRGLHAPDMGGHVAGQRIHPAWQPAHQNMGSSGSPTEEAAQSAAHAAWAGRLANSAASGLSRNDSSSSSQAGSSLRGPGDVEPAALQAAEVEQHADPGEQRVHVVVRVPDRALRAVAAGRAGAPARRRAGRDRW